MQLNHISEPRRPLMTYSTGSPRLWLASSPFSFQESISNLRLSQVVLCCCFTLTIVHPQK